MHDDKDRAQAKLKECGVKPGQIYRHYKGGLYTVVAVSLEEDTLEPLVAYHSNVKGTTWTRTLENFTEGVEFRGVTHSRFARVQE
jgi:hypothetical protein